MSNTIASKKQARLPFKLLADQPASPGPVNGPAGKKRKLSDDDSMCKITRTSASKLVEKKVTPIKGSNKVLILDENEVSSSSEAENMALAEKKTSAKAGLMKFFGPATQQQEVSTSGDIAPVIDNDSNHNRPLAEEPSSDENQLTPLPEELEEDLENTSLVSAKDDSICENDTSTDNKDVIDITMESDEERKTLPKRSVSDSSLPVPKVPEVNDDQQGKKKMRAKSAKSTLKEKEKAQRMKEREDVRLEKERKKHEEKQKKQEEKEKKEREKAEKREQLEKEKQEKMKAREDEKRKRLESSEAEKLKKEEERKKKELEKLKKDEDKRKKEEEKQKKDEEKQKEEEELLKKKEKEKAAFMSFFKKTERANEESSPQNHLFMAFTIGKGMALAPARRNKLETGAFDETYNEQCTSQKLYLQQLKMGEITPLKCEKTIPQDTGDIMILDEDAPDLMKAKFLKFHQNTRPAYYGTWRKRSKLLTPRNPFKKDCDLFDYEVDSDDEWEEEEPGESLSNSEGEDEGDNENTNDDEDEDGFFVPHGYLSEGEGCEEDDDITPEKMKAKQQASQRAFEVELKRQCRKLVPIVIGCFWQYDESTCLGKEILKDFECTALRGTPIMTTHNATVQISEAANAKEEKKGAKRKAVPEEAMPELIRLLHGNVNGIKKLLHEFRVFWKQRCSGGGEDVEKPAKSTEEADSPTPADEISKRQLEMKIQSVAEYKKGDYPRKCWYVKNEVLIEYQLTNLPVPTEWVYVTDVEPKDTGRSTPTSSKAMSRVGSIKQFAVKTTSEDLFTSPSAVASPKPRPSLAQFASPVASPKPRPLTSPFTSPNGAPPRPVSSPLSVKPWSSPSEACSPGVDTLGQTRKIQSPVANATAAKPARRVQLTTLSSFMAKADAAKSNQSVKQPDAVNTLVKPSLGAASLPAQGAVGSPVNAPSAQSANASSIGLANAPSEVSSNTPAEPIPSTSSTEIPAKSENQGRCNVIVID